MRGADYIWSRLAEAGIVTCFANPGTSEMHLVAALDRAPDIRGILCLQENVATGAADGYGRMSDGPAVTLLHLGPGLANGLANLHNARRAGTPILNLVGDYDAGHIALDAPLASDIASLAVPMSDWTGEIRGIDGLATGMDAAIAAAATGVATLTVGADVTWAECGEPRGTMARAAEAPAGTTHAVRLIADALRSGERVAFILSGRALRAEPLRHMAAIAAATGARFFARGANARIERGRNRVPVERLPYAWGPATQMLAGIDRLVLVDAALPTTFFPYPGQPGIVHPESCTVTALCPAGGDPARMLAELAACCGAIATAGPHARPPARTDVSGSLTLDALNAVMAAELPEQAIVCDEVITSGGFYAASAGSAPHDYLQLTGGAIGAGIPLALGAAIAAPGRRVIGLQADGSGLYTLQGLWTMARERLDVTIVIFANRSYRILQNEMRKVGVDEISERAQAMLSLEDPSASWVDLARGFGVEAALADSAGRFQDLWRHSMGRSGPFLIEAAIA